MLLRLFIKTLVSALLIAGISEVGRRSTFLAAILASLPLSSLLAIFWLYQDTQDVQKIMALSWSIFLIVIPSLVLFIALPLFLKTGLNFYLALLVSCGLTAVSYFVYLRALAKFGIEL